MTSAEFDKQFNRLTEHFHLPADSSRDTIGTDWFKAVEHYHVDALERAVTDLIRTAQDRFWPPLGKLTSAIRNRIAGMDRQPGKCATCHGSSWIDVAPFKSNHMIYENVLMRCPDCGIPAPPYTEPSRREPLTSREHAEWRMGDAPKQYMPEAQQAKPWDEAERIAHKTAMMAVFEKLRIKLFGKDAA
jgi:hypothetical protein